MEGAMLYFETLFEESGNLILLFFVTGIVFNIFAEIIKKQIFPAYSPEELAAGKVQKEMPSWIGMLFGIFLMIVFISCAVAASMSGTPHCKLIGGNWFLPVWCVAYYVWQMVCMKLVQMVMKILFPKFMMGNKPQKPPKPKYIRVPADSVVVEDTSEEIRDING